MDVELDTLTTKTLEHVIAAKAEFILSIIEQSLLDPITSVQQAVIVRCVKEIYTDVLKTKKQAQVQQLIE